MSHGPQAKRRRIELSLKTKIDLILTAESVPKLNQNQLTETFGIVTSTVSDILKKKEEYCVQYENNASIEMVLICLLFVCVFFIV